MPNLSHYYPIQSIKVFREYLDAYLPLIIFGAKQYELNLNTFKISGDHLGLQVLSRDEFDKCHEILLKIADLIHDSVIHNRRNRVYRFNDMPKSNSISVPRIEIFEPKPSANISKLRPGIEHIAFMMDGYDNFVLECKKKNVPIDKEVSFEDGSKFFKTTFVNGIEIEFRNDELGEWS
jgi:hypothetical protein